MNNNYRRRYLSPPTIVAAAAIGSLVLRASFVAFAEPPAEQVASEFAPLPPDLPLPASPPSTAAWLREANILQPYGHSAFTALTAEPARAARLKKEFGFNAIIVQPTDSHNTIAAAADKLTEDQFRTGIEAYRAAGYRIMLYTSVMALGLSPEFQSGEIARQHPDWLQRDPKGNPVMAWGVPWLCPSTAARDAALDRCVRIAHEYHADGVMLDNNEFFFAEAGWTCHCDACTKAFRAYVDTRCGADKCEQLFGVAPPEIKIPTEEGPLYSLWLHWRNRDWAEINETFRTRLRQENPDLMLFANTQYAYENGMLGTDLQYEREDVVLSESCNLDPRQMSEKMVLGHAVAAGRPLWNYIGTFAKPDDYTGLRSPDVIGPAIAATIAHNARPWIVDGFDEGPTDPKSRELMSTLLSWHATHQQFFTNQRWAAVGTLISLVSRNVRHTPLIPPSVSALQSAGVPVIALRDDKLTPEQLRPFRVMTVETATCLSDQSATALAAWVRAGGTLIAAADTGMYDELGRKRPHSPLWKSLDLDAAPTKQTKIGRGSVLAPAAAEFAPTAVQLSQPFTFLATPITGTEVVACRSKNSLQLHIVRHQPSDRPLALRLPSLFTPSNLNAKLFTPGSDDFQPLTLTTNSGRTTLTVPNPPLYCVVAISVQK